MAEDKEMSAPIVDGKDPVTGNIISTTVGGKNGEPKQTVNNMVERIVGTGSFGIVFQVDPLTHQVKLCDFGSAKMLFRREPKISYICSRYYHAPELIFGATEYMTSIDVLSAGCVLAELLLGRPLFPGEKAVDQLVKIIKVLGRPTREEICCMNPSYTDFRFPQIKAKSWHKGFDGAYKQANPKPCEKPDDCKLTALHWNIDNRQTVQRIAQIRL